MSNQIEYSSYIDGIFQKSDDKGLILSSELQESEIDIIYDFINKMYKYFTTVINHPHTIDYANGTSKEASEIYTREYYNKLIKAILYDREIVQEWYHNNNLYIPGTAEAIKHNKKMYEFHKKVSTKFEMRKEKEAKTGVPILRKNDAFTLLKKLESEEYVTTKTDDIIKHHPNFKKYTSLYTKSKRTHFNVVIQKLNKEKVLPLEEFYSICDCPKSKFFKDNLIESIKYACTNPRGIFYENPKFRTLKLVERRINDTNEKELVFTIKTVLA